MNPDPNTYARDVANEMLILRGWRSSVPADVRDDVFNTMTKHNRLYCDGFAKNRPAKQTAQLIQDREWDT